MTNKGSSALVEDLTNAAERATAVDVVVDSRTGERIVVFQFEGAMPAFIRMTPDLTRKLMAAMVEATKQIMN